MILSYSSALQQERGAGDAPLLLDSLLHTWPSTSIRVSNTGEPLRSWRVFLFILSLAACASPTVTVSMPPSSTVISGFRSRELMSLPWEVATCATEAGRQAGE